MDDVSLPIKCQEKQNITVVCAKESDRMTHKIQFTAKGMLNVTADNQLGDCYLHLKTFSKKGWIDNSTFY